MNFKDLPKVELHCHLDGSLRVDTVLELMKEEGIDLGYKSYGEIKNMLVVPNDCPSLKEYLKRFDLPLKLMQSRKNLKRIAYELIEDVNKENVKYIEVRFAPLLHKEKGLKVFEIIESVLEGLREGERDFGVKSNLILSILRNMPVDSSYEVLEGGLKFIGNGVVALDLAGNEVEGFAKDFEEAFNLGRQYGYKITIHAGETGFSSNVIDSINILKAERIGHGVAIENDKYAYELVRKNNITLEMCPKSNIQTKAVNSYEKHPVKKFLDDDLLVSVNTDNRTVSNISLTEEFYNLNKIFVLSKEDYKKIYLDSVKGAFCDEATKKWLVEQIE